jgi:surfeit locus 1 family protein
MRFWVVTLACLVTMGVTASLGMWQLGRADQKTTLQAAIDRQTALPPLDVSGLLATPALAEVHHRSARLRGTWETHATVFLENRSMAGQAGFHVVTPLRLAGSDARLLVVRGWAPRDFQDRARVPRIPTPAGEVSIEGRLAPPPSRYYELGDPGHGLIRQNIDVAAFSRETGFALLDLSLLQTGETDDGLRREWPIIAADVHKHYGYAAQWFGLCALAGILYVWFQFIQPRRRRRPT